eukprot:5530900-Pyramimonas_sp.AAC.1
MRREPLAQKLPRERGPMPSRARARAFSSSLTDKAPRETANANPSSNERRSERGLGFAKTAAQKPTHAC